jgi:hypothetical protein
LTAEAFFMASPASLAACGSSFLRVLGSRLDGYDSRVDRHDQLRREVCAILAQAPRRLLRK